jgi:hypothetical protein
LEEHTVSIFRVMGLCLVDAEVVRAKNSVEYIHEGHAVAQLVETLLYKPEGRGFDSRWCHWNFSLT